VKQVCLESGMEERARSDGWSDGDADDERG